MADIKNRINKTFVKSGKMGQAVFGRRNIASIGIDSLQPELRNPLLNIENYFFPFSRKELNSWLNYYSIVHPVVSNALDLHSTLPWSSFKFEGIDDEDVLSYYQDVADDLKLFEMFMDITKHYFQYGEALPYAHWDNRIDCFDYIQLLMPDDVIIDSVNPLDVRFRVDVKNMTEMIWNLDAIVDKDNRNRNSFVDNLDNNSASISQFYISHISRGRGIDGRGISLIYPCIKDLMYEDQLRKAQFVTASRRISPWEHWSIGESGENGWMPDKDYLDEFMRNLGTLGNEVSPMLLTGPNHVYEAIGIADRFINLKEEFEFIMRRLMIGLFTNETAILGTGSSFATASVSMRYVQARYDYVRSLILEWCQKKILIPIALANRFFKPEVKEISGQYRSGSVLRKKQWNVYIKPLLDSQNELIAEKDYIEQQNITAGRIGCVDKCKERINDINYTLGNITQKLSFHMRKYRNDLLLPSFRWLGKVSLLNEDGQIEFLTSLYRDGKCSVKVLSDVFGVNYDYLKKNLCDELGVTEKELTAAGDTVFSNEFIQTQKNKIAEKEQNKIAEKEQNKIAEKEQNKIAEKEQNIMDITTPEDIVDTLMERQEVVPEVL